MTEQKIYHAFNQLLNYCEEKNFKGFDPYDGLNSSIYQKIPFVKHHKLFRLYWIQLLKRIPVKYKFMAGIKPDYNAKGLGLFLSGYCNLYKINKIDHYLDKIKFLKNKIISLESKGYAGACWGYNFDWQSKSFFLPKNTPTVVSSSFVANSLLDAFEISNDEKLLNKARSTCDFILENLNRTYSKRNAFCFSYSPADHAVVYNASLLGSRLLARVYYYTKEISLLKAAKSSVEYCVKEQKDNGSWMYGKAKHHQWIDNFHTGYNLECLSDYMKYTEDNTYQTNLSKGLDFYINTFFSEKKISAYYSDRIYPIDIHTISQLIITLNKLDLMNEYKKLIHHTLNWTIDNMQSPEGYFYYQKKRLYTDKSSYMRWSQAWMFYALSVYLYHIEWEDIENRKFMNSYSSKLNYIIYEN